MAGYGTWNTRTLRAQLAGREGDTSYSLAAGYYETDGYDATRPTISFDRHNPDDDGYRNTNVSAKLAHRFGDRHEIGAAILQSDGRTSFDNGLATDDRTEQTLSTVSAFSRNRFCGPMGKPRSHLRAGATTAKASVRLPGHRFRTDQDQALWQNTFRFDGQSIVAGLEYLGQEVDATTAYEANKRTVRSAFAGYVGEFGSPRARGEPPARRQQPVRLAHDGLDRLRLPGRQGGAAARRLRGGLPRSLRSTTSTFPGSGTPT